jgi:hypothetical protein
VNPPERRDPGDVRKFIVALTVLGLVAACGSATVATSSPSPRATPTLSPSPAESPSPSPSPFPTPSPVPSSTPPAGFYLADSSGGSVASNAVVAVRVGQHPGYDRIVIEFVSGVPNYTVTRQSTPAFIRSPRGDQVTLEGSAGVLIVIHSVNNWTSYAGPTAFHPGYPYLRQALLVENFEGYQQWALGIQGTPALRVFTLASPSRLVVDVTGI